MLNKKQGHSPHLLARILEQPKLEKSKNCCKPLNEIFVLHLRTFNFGQNTFQYYEKIVPSRLLQRVMILNI